MSKAEFYFSLYNQNKPENFNNEDFHTMATELFWLMATLEVEFDAWDTICNFITLGAEYSNSKENVNSLLLLLKQEINPDDSTYFAKHVLMIHNALMGPDAPVIEVTLPVLRMIILTEDRLEQFIQTTIPTSFKLEKTVIERQKGFGHEIFEALFLEGKKLANNMAYPDHLTPNEDKIKSAMSRLTSSPAVSPRPRSTVSNNSVTPSSKASEEEYEII